MAQKAKSIFVCQECGAQRSRWEGKCSDCGAWNSFTEERSQSSTQRPQRASSDRRGWSTAGADSSAQGRRPVSLADFAQKFSQSTGNQIGHDQSRLDTGIGELNRVLGGGLVDGSFTLVGGDPGIGKSTLLLQMALSLAEQQHNVLYVSGEESVNQTFMRAQRIGFAARSRENLELASESELESIREMALEKKPRVLIVDSIQTVFLNELASAPGSVTQVRECAAELMHLAKRHQIAVFVIGHVNKDGQIAGPKVLEHMVDTVLSFEGDKTQAFRLLRAIKNRFGPTHELGVFAMDQSGLVEVLNPSELFLEERSAQSIGSAVTCSLEGTRPLLCEIQALTIGTHMPVPRRTSIGFDTNRVHLLAAILHRHLGLNLPQSDVFINVVGGLKLEEPATDFAVAAAIISSEAERPVEPDTCFFGELGLTGETRAVPFTDLRIREARKLGFKRFVLPTASKKQLKQLGMDREDGLIFVSNLAEFSAAALGESKPYVKNKRSTRPIPNRESPLG